MSGYVPNVPLSNQSLGQTQPTINTNFMVLNTIYGFDHVPYTTTPVSGGGNGGKHFSVSLVSLAFDPTALSLTPIVYSKQVTYPGAVVRTELFTREASGDGGTVIQLSNFFNAPIASTNGSSFLPGGVVMKWGNTGVVSDNSTVPFASAFPNSCFGVVLTIIDPNATSKTINVKTGSLGKSNFVVRLSSGSISAFYYAIGN